MVNFVYCSPVGHAIEALRYCLGYHRANKDYEISLVLNKNTAVVLASLCPWIKEVYTVDIISDEIFVTSSMYSHIPQKWDYIMSDSRSRDPTYCPAAYFDYYQQCGAYFEIIEIAGCAGDASIPYLPNQTLRFTIPAESLAMAKQIIRPTEVKIALLPCGSANNSKYPSVESWRSITDGLGRLFPDLSIYLIGKLNRESSETTSGMTKEHVSQLLRSCPQAVNVFDIGLLSQLAICEQCDLLMSPHTGFAFAAMSVGTPWLSIAGGRWPEYFFNGVPFYSVLPDPHKYSSYTEDAVNEFIQEEGDLRLASMSRERISSDMPEILNAAETLINQKLSYEGALKEHFAKMVKFYGGSDKIYSFDDIHLRYLP